MLHKGMFRSEFGKEIWRKYFYYLDTPEKEAEKPVSLPVATREAKAHVITNEPTKQQTLESIAEKEDAASKLVDRPLILIKGKPPELRPPELKTDDFESVFHKGTQTAVMIRNHPTLHDIVSYYKSQGVVGEESLAVAITLAASNGISFGVEGFSGSGKTFIVDRLMDLLPEEWVYRIELSSKLAMFYEADKVNGRRILYIPELQKAMQDKKAPIIEVIKNLTEGKDANRVVTKKDGTGSKEYSIKAGRTVVYTLALENYFKKDEESARRLMRLQTDSSKEHLDEIHDSKARRRFSVSHKAMDVEQQKESLKAHIVDVSGMDLKVIDPFAECFKEFIPRTQKSIGYVDHYYGLVDACVKFNYTRRQQINIDGTTYLIADIEDHFNIFRIYYKEFKKTLRDFAKRMSEGPEKEQALAELVDTEDPKWADCLTSAYCVLADDPSLDKVRKLYPDIADKWLKRQCDTGYVQTQDYKTGQPRHICEAL